MRAIEFIFESYPLAKKEFSQMANPDVVQATIDQYRELVKKNQFRNPEEKNINYWRERGWEAFSQMVKIKSTDITDTQRKRGKVVGNAITLQDDAEWVVLIPLDKETSVHYGKGTEWCTTKPNQTNFEDYVYNRNIILVYAIDKTRTGRSVAISIEPDAGNGEQIEMFNQNDDSISATKYKEISGLDSGKFIQMAKLPENQQQLNLSIEKYKVARAKTAELLRTRPIDPEAIERELKFTKNADDCYTYVLTYGKEQNRRIAFHPIIIAAAADDIKDIEPQKAVEIGQYIDFSTIPGSAVKSILRLNPTLFTYNFESLSSEQRRLFVTSAAAAYQYATVILNGTRFPEGEPAIATSAHYSTRYASYVLNNTPFPLGEPTIATSSLYSYVYAYNVLEKPFPLGEPAIATNAEHSSLYAYDVLEKPFPLGEPTIATSAEYSIEYARAFADQLPDNRFAAGEPAIATDAEYSIEYAYNVLKKPFPLGEPTILSEGSFIQHYYRLILKNHRSLSWEQLIKDDSKKSLEYARARNEPFPAGEPAILSSEEHTQEYYKRILKNYRSPSWEQLIKDDPENSLRYATERNEPFPAGEPAILDDLDCAETYVQEILANHRSLTWEQLIKDDTDASHTYAVLRNKPFPAGEAAIAADPEYAAQYDKLFGTSLAQQNHI